MKKNVSWAMKGETDKQTQDRLDLFKQPVKFESDFQPRDLAEIIHRAVILGEQSYYGKNPKRSSRVQCDTGRRRSAEDIYRISKNYIDGITYSQVKATLRCLNQNNIVRHNYCYTTHKYVYHPFALSTELNTIKNRLNNLNLKVNGSGNKSGRQATEGDDAGDKHRGVRKHKGDVAVGSGRKQRSPLLKY